MGLRSHVQQAHRRGAKGALGCTLSNLLSDMMTVTFESCVDTTIFDALRNRDRGCEEDDKMRQESFENSRD